MSSTISRLIFIALITVLSNCQTPSGSGNQELNKEASSNPPILEPDKTLSIYKYDSTYTDSALVTTIEYVADSMISGNTFYYRIPFEGDFISSYILDQLKGKDKLETFDSLICETGGKSAWNKYLVEYDSLDRPLTIKHHKAWWNEGLGDSPRPEKPAYFLGATIEFEYEANSVRRLSFDGDGELIERIEKRFDHEDRLTYDHWDSWGTYRFKAFYSY